MENDNKPTVQAQAAPEATKPNPWEMPWEMKAQRVVTDAVDSVQSAVSSVKSAVASIKMPWERDWDKKERAPVATAPVAPQSPPATATLDIKAYTSKMIRAESNGVADAKNPNSTATGVAQFTEGTWTAETKRLGLDYTLDDRKDPAKVEKVLAGFTQRNLEKARTQLGREPTEHELYLYHFIPAKAAALINAPASDAAVDYVSTAVSKANKTIFYRKNEDGEPIARTIAEVINIFKKKMRSKNG